MLKNVAIFLLLTLFPVTERLASAQTQELALKQAAGHLISVKGKVVVIRNKTAVRPGQRYRLEVGDKIVLAANSSAQVMHYTARARYLLRPGTTVLVEGKRLSVGKSEPTVVSRLTPAAMTPTPQTRRILGQWLRGEKGLDSPQPTIGAVTGPEVVLKWANNIPFDKRTGLILELKRKGDAEPLQTESLEPTATTFTVNISDDSLYRWKVRSQDDKFEVSGVFRLLTPEEKAAVDTLEKSAKAMHKSNPNDPAAELLLARGYENVWLFEKALDCYRLAQAHSSDKDAYKEEITQLTEMLSKKY